MSEFLTLITPLDAKRILFEHLPIRILPSEEVPIMESLGRVLAEEVRAPHPLPQFSRAAMDGYAVRAKDTFGASDSLPGYLSMIGEVLMGEAPAVNIKTGECCLIHTGGMLPTGADAVIMLENTQVVKNLALQKVELHSFGRAQGEQGTLVEIQKAVAVGENTIREGEDVAEGELVLHRGSEIRPAEIGCCAAFGITGLRVVKKPLVGIISTGDEVIPMEETPKLGQVRDVNTYSLKALVNESGGEPVDFGIISDCIDDLRKAAREIIKECDIVVICAGSSASERDRTAEVISELGNPGVLVHGINIKPGKPTILAICNGTPIFGLPGNPVSALVIATIFLKPVIERFLGKKASPNPIIMARLAANIPSTSGREEWIPVTLAHGPGSDVDGVDILAEPIFSKSNLICTYARADGLVRIDKDATGLEAGTIVRVQKVNQAGISDSI